LPIINNAIFSQITYPGHRALDDTGLIKGALQMKSNGRKLVLLTVTVICSLFCRHAFGQKIYLLVAADTKDPNIGESDRIDSGNVFNVFYSQIPREQIITYGEPTSNAIWTGPSLQDADDMKSVILKALDSCPAGQDDTIIFYWSGHGAYDTQGHYLVMPLPNRQPLYRHEIITTIQKKSPRLTVVMSDSCNTEYNSRKLARPVAPAFAPPEQVSPLFDELFLKHKGLVNINASSENEEAIGLDTCGGLFTASLAANNLGQSTGTVVRFEVSTPDQSKIIELPNGFFWRYENQRKNWNDLVTDINQTIQRKCRGLTKQTIRVWSLPTRYSGDTGGHLPRTLSLTHGDVVLSINGNAIQTANDCISAVKTSNKIMTFTVRDSRDGTIWSLQSELEDSHQRFGINVEDDPGGGALVTHVIRDMPCTRNRVLGKVGWPITPEGDTGQYWSDPKYHPESGDHIIEVNGRQIANVNDFYHAVKESPDWITFRVIDHRTEKPYIMRTKLNHVDAKSRLGIVVHECDAQGVHVDDIYEDSPGTRCQIPQ
jgi:hypothetical protein